MIHSQVDVAPQPSAMTTHEQISGETFLIINNETNEIFGTQTQPDNTTIIQKINTIIANQNEIKDTQKRFAHRLGHLVLEIETKIEKVIKRVLDSQTVATTSLGSASTIENTAFKLKPIECINDLEDFELLLHDPAEKNKLMQLYSILCTRSDGHGITCAYKLIDVLFTREFLCQCSWSGGSRGDKIKIALKGYKNVLDFFFRMVLSWDKNFTTDANEKFFKLVLRNSEQRKKIKNLRKPAQRKRTHKSKNQSQKIEKNAEKEEDGEDVEEKKEEKKDEVKDSEEDSEKNLEEEIEKGKENEMGEDLEEESDNNLEEDLEEEWDKNLEEEIEKDKDNDMEMENNLEEEWDKNLEEEIEQDKDNDMEMENNLEEEVEEIDKDLEKVTEKDTKKKVEEDILNTMKMVSQNKENENKEKSCNKFKNFRAVKNLKARDNGMHQTASKTNQRNMGDRPGSSNNLKTLKTAPKKIKSLDNNNQSVTPPKKLKQSH